jgi:histidine triad (HIT) family protein
MENCIFCKIVNNELPSRKVYEDNLVIAILDLFPVTDGHTLVIPKKHIRDIHTLDDETALRIMQVAKQFAGLVQSKFEFPGSTIMASNGEAQDVPHFHMHVIGRKKPSDLQFVAPTDTNETPEHLDQIAEILKIT